MVQVVLNPHYKKSIADLEYVVQRLQKHMAINDDPMATKTFMEDEGDESFEKGTVPPSQTWILFWDYLEHKETKIQFWWSLTGFQRWLTLYHTTSLMMLRMLPTCTSKRFCVYMVFPRLWLQIETLSFLVTFGELCGGNLGLLYYSVPLITLRLMVKPKILIEAWEIF